MATPTDTPDSRIVSKTQELSLILTIPILASTVFLFVYLTLTFALILSTGSLSACYGVLASRAKIMASLDLVLKSAGSQSAVRSVRGG